MRQRSSIALPSLLVTAVAFCAPTRAAAAAGGVFVPANSAIQRYDANSGDSVPLDRGDGWPFGGTVDDAAGNGYGIGLSRDGVVIFDNNGAPLGRSGSAGSGPGQFRFARDCAVGADGRIDVVDKGNPRVQVLGAAPVPERAATWGRVTAGYH